jgi:hypothetical protein
VACIQNIKILLSDGMLAEFEILTAAVMKVAIFLAIEPCIPYTKTFRRSVSPPNHLPSHLLAHWFLARLIFYPEIGGDTLLSSETSVHMRNARPTSHFFFFLQFQSTIRIYIL